MKYIMIEDNNLGKYFRNGMKEEQTGLKFIQQIQRGKLPMVSVAEVVDTAKAAKVVNELNLKVKEGVESYNEDLESFYVKQYQFWNETLASSDYQLKASKGLIDIKEVQQDWTQQERMKWLYDNGIMGIKTNNKPRYK